MSIERVRADLRERGLEERIRELPESSATVELAARALGTDPARIAKSLAFRSGDGALLVVAAGDARVDNARFKAQFHQKAKMLSPQETHDLIGHDVGGVCPFALPEGIPVWLDVSLRRFDTVFPAAGSSNSAVRLTCQELEEAVSDLAGWVDVCKGWRDPDAS